MAESTAGSSNPVSCEVEILKRKCTAHAFEECRHRKSRCNGARPSCDQCEDMGFTCRYRQPSKQSPSLARDRSQKVGLAVQTSMEERLDRMERILQSIVGSGQVSKATQMQSPPSSLVVASTTKFSDPIDGLGCITFSEEGSAEYFGRQNLESVDWGAVSRSSVSYMIQAHPRMRLS